MADRLTTVHLDDIHDSPDNLRQDLGDISDLANSIEFIGLIEPLRLQKNGDGYKVIAGHRRLAALRKLHSEGVLDPEVKVIIGNKLMDNERTAAMLIENMQRVDLAPKEEAEGVRRLVQDYEWTQAEIATNLGVSKQWVSDRIAMLNVPSEVFELERPLPVSHLAMLGKLPDDVRERLTKDGKVPTQYDIEDRTNQVAAKTKAAKELKAAVKNNRLAVTEKQLKRIVKSEIGELDGVDFMVKSVVGNITQIIDYMYRQATEPVLVLHLAHNLKVEEMDPKTIYVLKESGYPKWYTAQVEGTGVSTDPEGDEYERLCDEVDERNSVLLEAWKDECYDTQVRYLRDTKAAQLTADVAHFLIDDALRGWRAYEQAVEVSEYLDIALIDIPEQQEGEADDVYRQRKIDTQAEQVEAVLAYARKNGTQMIRTLAALNARRLVDVPERPTLEEYPESEGDELDGF